MNPDDLWPTDPQPFWVICQQCFTRYEFLVDPEGFEKWRQGTHIQYALPNNTADERELIKSQMCGTCFDKLFPPDDEE
jgi:hypothetical protein